MKLSAIISVRSHALCPNRCPPASWTRRQQSSLSKLETSLYNKFATRETPLQWDSIYPEASNNLSTTLEAYLPKSCRAPTENPRNIVPLGHHQVYFNPVYSGMHLLRDGTDDAHFPGPPYWERLWASGSLTFNPDVKWMMRYGLKGVLQEDVEDVKVKGREGEEKVFVTVSRKVAMYPALHLDPEPNANSPVFSPDLRTLNGTDLSAGKLGELAMEEKKTLVFMRRKKKDEIKQSLESVPRIIHPIHEPDFSITLRPKAPLLFRFSALTFNAHRIHLDRHYCMSTAGYRNLLVHGPLCQVLMLSVLRSQLDQAKREMVLRFDYKNLTPLFAYESMRVCTRRNPENPKKFDVWIEGPQGGYAVKATAEIGTEQDSDSETIAPPESIEPNTETGSI